LWQLQELGRNLKKKLANQGKMAYTPPYGAQVACKNVSSCFRQAKMAHRLALKTFEER